MDYEMLEAIFGLLSVAAGVLLACGLLASMVVFTQMFFAGMIGRRK